MVWPVSHTQHGEKKKKDSRHILTMFLELLLTADKSPIVWSYHGADFLTLIQATFLHCTTRNNILGAVSWKWYSPLPTQAFLTPVKHIFACSHLYCIHPNSSYFWQISTELPSDFRMKNLLMNPLYSILTSGHQMI